MKKRNSVILPVAATIGVLVSAAIRAFQLLIVVDYSEMGFFDTDAGFLPSAILYIFFVMAAIIFILCAVIDKKKDSAGFSRPTAVMTPKQTAVMGFAFLVAVCLMIYELVFQFDGVDFKFISDVIICVFFGITSVMLLARRSLNRAAGYLQLFVCIGYTFKAADLFMNDTVIVRVSEELVLLLYYVCAVLFFLSLGRFISFNETKFTRGKLVVYASLCATLSSAASLAGYIAYFVDGAYMSEHMGNHPLSGLGITLISLVTLWCIYGRYEEKTEN